MNLTRRFLLSAVATLMSGIMAVNAQTSVIEAFKSAPSDVFPLLDNNTRLDMIDYFSVNMTTPSKNNLDGSSRITAMTNESMNISMTAASDYQLALLPTTSGDSLIALIMTVATPAPDSKMTIYESSWKRPAITEKVFTKPSLADWLTAEGKKNRSDVEMMVPFMLISYSYDPASRKLTLTNNSRQFLAQEIYEIVEPYMLNTLTYQWNGKKFVAEK